MANSKMAKHRASSVPFVKKALLRIWSSPLTMVSLGIFLISTAVAVIKLAGTPVSITPLLDFYRSQPWIPLREVNQWVPLGAVLGANLLGFIFLARAIRIHIEEGTSPIYIFIVFSALTPPLLVLDSDATSKSTTLSFVQTLAVAITASTAQLIFAFHAWRIRKLHWKKILIGVHSGLIFAALNLIAYHAITVLALIEEPTRNAINGELWALLGAAQLLIALTSGVSEVRSARLEALIEHRFSAQSPDEP